MAGISAGRKGAMNAKTGGTSATAIAATAMAAIVRIRHPGRRPQGTTKATTCELAEITVVIKVSTKVG